MAKMHEPKDYRDWMLVKTNVHNNFLDDEASLDCRVGRVYWVCVGENVGFEQDGSGALFARPVLVLKKTTRNLFIGVPLTRQRKVGSFYHEFKMIGEKEASYAMLNQIKAFDTARISGKKPCGTVDGVTLREVIYKLIKLLVVG